MIKQIFMFLKTNIKAYLFVAISYSSVISILTVYGILGLVMPERVYDPAVTDTVSSSISMIISSVILILSLNISSLLFTFYYVRNLFKEKLKKGEYLRKLREEYDISQDLALIWKKETEQ